MLSGLLGLRQFCHDWSPIHHELYMEPEDWNNIEDIHQALSPAASTSKVLQKEQLTAGDFYLKWLKLNIALKKFDSTFSDSSDCHKGQRTFNFRQRHVRIGHFHGPPS